MYMCYDFYCLINKLRVLQYGEKTELCMTQTCDVIMNFILGLTIYNIAIRIDLTDRFLSLVMLGFSDFNEVLKL